MHRVLFDIDGTLISSGGAASGREGVGSWRSMSRPRNAIKPDRFANGW